MKRIALALLVLGSWHATAQQTLAGGVKELASQITTSATKQEKQRIAVLPFRELDGQPTVFGTYLAEELVTNLFQLGNFKIVERQLLDKVMGELRIQHSGAIDPATAKEIGRIAAVDAIVTGSITELENFVSINCRLIDTTTGEVFGAAQTKITKDSDVGKLMNIVVADESAASSGSRPAPSTNKILATRDLGTIRMSLVSVRPVHATRNGHASSRLRWTFELHNREAKRNAVVAINAEPKKEPEQEEGGLRFVMPSAAPQGIPLRASLVDDRDGLWKLSSTGLGGIGFVQAGVHGRRGRDGYSAHDIVKLLNLRDELGRDTDDPSDGFTARADSVGEGGQNVTFGGGGITSPPRFFRNEGNRFISGSTITIAPGQSVAVTLDFDLERSSSGYSGSVYQFNGEIVAGVSQGGTRHSYVLHSVMFDRISVAVQQ